MLSNEDYVVRSLELNLFFMRIMKEHSFFLEASFLSKNSSSAQQADTFKNQFTALLAEAVKLSDGVVSPKFLHDGEIVTDLTFDAERVTEFYSGVSLNTNLTQSELNLAGRESSCISATLVDQVNLLNQQAIAATTGLASFKAQLLSNVISCQLFTFNYPLLIEHILREARFYLTMLGRLQCRSVGDPVAEMIEQEIFWNRIMAEHSKFIRGLLDPTEDQLFNTADHFGKEFDVLTAKAISLINQTAGLPAVTMESKKATTAVRDFKHQGTEGLITCKVRSIMVPLLGDHVTREANHFLRLLKMFEGMKCR